MEQQTQDSDNEVQSSLQKDDQSDEDFDGEPNHTAKNSKSVNSEN